MLDPRNNKTLWMLMRCTGGTDAWTDPHQDPRTARHDRAAAWVVAAGAVIVAAAFAAALLVEVARWG